MNQKLPEMGAAVVTSDGHLLGHVAEVAGDCFKVHKPMDIDDWIALDAISSIDRDVRLSLSLEDLEGDPEGIEHMGYHVHHEN
jgi:hypothetical protein